MIDVYAIGTTLKIKDLASPELLKMAKVFEKLDLLTVQLGKRFKQLGNDAKALKSLDVASKAIADNLRTLSQQALLASKNIDKLGQAKSAVQVGRLGIEKELIGANVQATMLAGKLHAMRGGVLGGGGGMPLLAGGGGRGGHRGGGLHGGNLHVGSHGFGMSSVGMGLAGDMMVPVAAAMGAAYVGHTFYEGAKEYQDEFNRFKALNLGDQVNAEADKFVKGTHTFGTSQAELMRAMSESVGLFGSFSEASKFTPALVTLGKANSAIFGDDKVGALDDEGLKSLQKFIDRRGGFKDEATFKRSLNLAEKMVTGSGGFLKFNDLGQFSQQAGTAFRGLSDEGLLHMQGLLIEQGGARAGTALMSIYQNLVAGRTPKKTMALIQDLGLGKVIEQTHGSVGGKPMKSIVMGDIKEQGLLQSDPARWMDEVLLPALAKKGITSEDQVLKTVNDVLSNRTGSGQASIMTTQQFQLMRDYRLAQGAMGADDVTKLYANSASGSEADFTAAWADFKKEFGQTMLPAITDMLKAGTALLRTISSIHPVDAEPSPVLPKSGIGDSGIDKRGFGGWVAGFVGAKGASHAETSTTAPKGDLTVKTDVHLDSHVIASTTSKVVGNYLSMGMGTGSVDSGLALPMPGN